MGRRIDPLADRNAVECCSVSKSTYSYAGDPLSGPASKVLRTYRVKVEGDTLTVELD
jgi:Rieske Fe-S protein